MKSYSRFITIFFLFLKFCDAQNMIIKDIKKPVSVAWINNNEYVIGGKNGCIRGQFSENIPVLNKKIITEEEIEHIAINNNRTLLGLSLLSINKLKNCAEEIKHALYHTETDSLLLIANSSYDDTCTSIAFNSINDSLFICTTDELTQYTSLGEATKQYSHQWKRFPPFINYHPTQNRLLCLSEPKGLKIYEVNPSYLDLKTKMLLDVCIDAAEYSPMECI